MTTIQKLCESKGVTIAPVLLSLPDHFTGTEKRCRPVRRASLDGEWKANSFAWRVTLSYKGRELRTMYYAGCGHVTKRRGNYEAEDWLAATPPAAHDVLGCLCSDASSADESFPDWCSSFGYETDSRTALDTYLACQETGRELRTFLGKDLKAFTEAEF